MNPCTQICHLFYRLIIGNVRYYSLLFLTVQHRAKRHILPHSFQVVKPKYVKHQHEFNSDDMHRFVYIN